MNTIFGFLFGIHRSDPTDYLNPLFVVLYVIYVHF